jgi:Ni/Co efflux regulator RcnB
MLKELGENVFNAIILNIWMIKLVCVIIVQKVIKKQWIVYKIINKYKDKDKNNDKNKDKDKNRDKNKDKNKDKDKDKDRNKDLVKNYNNQAIIHNKMILKMAFNLIKTQIKNTN